MRRVALTLAAAVAATGAAGLLAAWIGLAALTVAARLGG